MIEFGSVDIPCCYVNSASCSHHKSGCAKVKVFKVHYIQIDAHEVFCGRVWHVDIPCCYFNSHHKSGCAKEKVFKVHYIQN